VRRLAWRRTPLRLRHVPASRSASSFTQEKPAYSAPISADTRLFVWNRDGGRCRNCGADRHLQFDHIIPKSKGGSGVAENVELLCRDCNLRKRAGLIVPSPTPG